MLDAILAVVSASICFVTLLASSKIGGLLITFRQANLFGKTTGEALDAYCAQQHEAKDTQFV